MSVDWRGVRSKNTNANGLGDCLMNREDSLSNNLFEFHSYVLYSPYSQYKRLSS
uniref:Uncharacterized protein n=1 Tax=Solanum tuberosum TaxID=4113 RepID=M1C045_SOLTU